MADCGLLNLASCIPQKLYEFIISIINAPIQPLLTHIKDLLIEPMDISILSSVWATILYVLSALYGLLLLYSGLNLMLSGHNAVKRAKSKEWFQNIFLLIILTQMSFFLYGLVLDLSASMTAGIMSLVSPDFFLLTADNLINIGLEFFLGMIYVITLIITFIFLTARYLIIGIGVVFFPIGIFLYFVPPLQDYGKLILNYLGVTIFVVFFDAIILLVGSQLIQIPFFENIKIVVMICIFASTNFLMLYFLLFTIIKSAFKSANSATGDIVAVTKHFT
jgi:hypothetical protein